MLLPSFDEMRVFLAPGQSGFVRLRRGLRNQTLEHGSANTMDALVERIKGRPLRVCTYLSSHYTRMLLLPWQPSLENEKEWSAYAQHAFDTAFGSSPGRKIRLARQGYGQPVIAAAIEATLHDEIEAAIQSAGSVSKSMEPYCSAAFDRHRGMLGENCWFFTAEPGIATAMRMDGGVLKSIAMHPLEAETQESLMATIGRELAKTQAESITNTVFVHATVPLEFKQRDLPDIDVQLLAAGRDDALGIAP